MSTQNEKRNLWKLDFWKIFSIVAAIVIIILLFFVINSNKEIERLQKKLDSIESEKAEIDSLKMEVAKLKAEKEMLKGFCVNNSESLKEAHSIIEKLIDERNQPTQQINAMRREISGMRREISRLGEKLDSVIAGKIVEPATVDTTSTFEADSCKEVADSIINVELSIKMKQISFDKKGNKINSTSSNYSVPNSILPGKGFESVDSTGVVSLGDFVTKDNRRVELTYYALLKGNAITYQVIETDKETGVKKVLVPYYTELPSGAGGLLTKENPLFYEPWEGNYLKEQIDESLKKKAPWQITKGVVEMGSGIAGYCYFNNNPEVIVNIFENGGSIHQQKFYNGFAKGVCIFVAARGVYDTYRGVKNSCGSVILSPTDIKLIFEIDKILNSINNSLNKY